MEAIASGKQPDKIFIQRGLRGDTHRELLDMLKQRGLPFQFVPIEKLNRITRKNHQGVVAFLTEIEYQRVEDILPGLFERGEEPLFVALDRVTDVRNFGAIARSAECLGAHAIIIPDRGAAPASADAVKSSAGALLRIPVCRESQLKNSLRYLQQSGLKLIAASEKGQRSLHDSSLIGPACLIMGSEEDGVSDDILKFADELCAIPMKGHTASLNVSVSAGIFLAEINRQRQSS